MQNEVARRLTATAEQAGDPILSPEKMSRVIVNTMHSSYADLTLVSFNRSARAEARQRGAAGESERPARESARCSQTSGASSPSGRLERPAAAKAAPVCLRNCPGKANYQNYPGCKSVEVGVGRAEGLSMR